MSDPDGTFERPDRRVVVTALGINQILAWGSTLYLLGVLGHPIALDTDWSYEAIIGGVSLGLLVASIISPRIGRAIGTKGGRESQARCQQIEQIPRVDKWSVCRG